MPPSWKVLKQLRYFKDAYLPPQEGEGLLQDLERVQVPVPVAWLQEQLLQLRQLDQAPLVIRQHWLSQLPVILDEPGQPLLGIKYFGLPHQGIGTSSKGFSASLDQLKKYLVTNDWGNYEILLRGNLMIESSTMNVTEPATTVWSRVVAGSRPIIWTSTSSMVTGTTTPTAPATPSSVSCIA